MNKPTPSTKSPYSNKGGRPEMGSLKRNVSLTVRLNKVEHIILKAKAKSAGHNLSTWMRMLALGKKVKQKTFTEEQLALRRQLIGVGNNLNQIAKKFNQGERPLEELAKWGAILEQLMPKEE